LVLLKVKFVKKKKIKKKNNIINNLLKTMCQNMLYMSILVRRSRQNGAKSNMLHFHGIELVGETYSLTSGPMGQRKNHPRFFG